MYVCTLLFYKNLGTVHFYLTFFSHRFWYVKTKSKKTKDRLYLFRLIDQSIVNSFILKVVLIESKQHVYTTTFNLVISFCMIRV